MTTTDLRSLTVAVSSMPGEYTRLRTAPTAPDITVWSASLSAIVVSTPADEFCNALSTVHKID